LCLGFEQITSTTPRRRMTRHRSHIGFTDVRTFIGPSGVVSINNLREKARPSHESDGGHNEIGPEADEEI
jgi:hypothetical protein